MNDDLTLRDNRIVREWCGQNYARVMTGNTVLECIGMKELGEQGFQGISVERLRGLIGECSVESVWEESSKVGISCSGNVGEKESGRRELLKRADCFLERNEEFEKSLEERDKIEREFDSELIKKIDPLGNYYNSRVEGRKRKVVQEARTKKRLKSEWKSREVKELKKEVQENNFGREQVGGEQGNEREQVDSGPKEWERRVDLSEYATPQGNTSYRLEETLFWGKAMEKRVLAILSGLFNWKIKKAHSENYSDKEFSQTDSLFYYNRKDLVNQLDSQKEHKCSIVSCCDGIIEDVPKQSCSSLLEIKCPYSCRHRNYIVVKDYLQLTTEMACYKVENAVYVIWTPFGFSIWQVRFDRFLWEKIHTEYHKNSCPLFERDREGNEKRALLHFVRLSAEKHSRLAALYVRVDREGKERDEYTQFSPNTCFDLSEETKSQLWKYHLL